ncbi:GH25 family lysozyme [Actinomadura sp. DC4]|uniref:GH25 family lysozyme n=1 Tax=Actinomadura sp. DC4 TaxID=3055069 RepID=UPI0025B1A75A|nr:GH25 family lysozyme [Actinomadura sp. DC4]MDN3357685.1 GH25 family lysozyme [Actinomadura sp. DC4]
MRIRVVLLVAAGACGVLTACSSADPGVPADHGSQPLTQPEDATVRSAATTAGLVPGIDISAYQPHVNWTTVKTSGAKFAYIKATEGKTYTSSTFASQYAGALNAGLAHGAYHFATPNTSSGVSQADYFVAHGGGGKADGHTLPGVLDIEKNPYGKDQCYGLTHAKMNAWITDFLHEYRARTGRHAVINTFRDWWISCTGNAGAKAGSVFGATYPLWVNDHKASAGSVPVPAAWKSYTVWQWTDKGTYGDEDYVKSSTVYKSLLAK